MTQAQEAVSEMSLDNRGDDDDDDDDEPAADMEEFEESGMLDEDTVSHNLYFRQKKLVTCFSGTDISSFTLKNHLYIEKCLLAHLWCAYAMVLCLSWIVRRAVGCVCVEHNYPKMWMD